MEPPLLQLFTAFLQLSFSRFRCGSSIACKAFENGHGVLVRSKLVVLMDDVSVSQICRYVGCVRADLLFFSFFSEGTVHTHVFLFFDIILCPR
jgi:hypothetical protein